MSVGKTLTIVSLGIAGVASVIAIMGLLHALTTAGDPHMLMHELENWLVTVGFHLAMIILAAAGVYYLAQKK